MKVRTSDLLLNPEEFTERADYIRTDVNTFEDLMRVSELGKIYEKKHSNGMIVYYKHPSIESYSYTLKNLNPDIIAKYAHLIDMVYAIDRIAIPVKRNEVIYLTNPNDIVVMLSKLKSAEEKFEIMDMINEVRPHSIPVYGYKETTCPACGAVNPKEQFSMEALLFFKASREEEMATLRWAAKMQQKGKKKSKKK
jgi:hypothetical protein